MNIGKYAKAVVAVCGAVVSSLAPYYGGQHWFVGLTVGLAAVATILVPNQTQPGTPENPTVGVKS